MSILDVIKSRRSIRAFEERVPSKEIILECLSAAVWAPNPTNQQPWEFVVAMGKELEKITEVLKKNFSQRIEKSDPYGDLPEPCEKRKEETFASLFHIAQIEEIDPNTVLQWSLSFYKAPIVVLFVTYKKHDNLYQFGTIAALQNFLLAVHEKGLGSCWTGVARVCQEDIKRHLGISEDKEILGGVGVGYPDKNSPFNTFDRTRIPVDEITRWLGFHE